jgi:hypothetical protein
VNLARIKQEKDARDAAKREGGNPRNQKPENFMMQYLLTTNNPAAVEIAWQVAVKSEMDAARRFQRAKSKLRTLAAFSLG